jgi:opacity protein-like surface antigen
MQKFVITGAAVLMFTVAASAQDYQKMDTFLGYTFTRFNSAHNLSAFNANGGSAQWAYNFNHWFSGVLDGGAVHNGGIHNANLNTTVTTLLAGPRVSMRSGRFVPYIQTLFGGAWAATSADACAGLIGCIVPPNVNLRYTKTISGFAMTAGGGLDVKVSKHVSIRPVQAEYLLTRLQPFGDFSKVTQNNFRYSAGINFTYGGAQ